MLELNNFLSLPRLTGGFTGEHKEEKEGDYCQGEKESGQNALLLPAWRGDFLGFLHPIGVDIGGCLMGDMLILSHHPDQLKEQKGIEDENGNADTDEGT